MIKNVILTVIMILGMAVYAEDNYLNSVVLSEADGSTSVILRTDNVTKVKKSTDGPNKLTLTLKNTKQSNDISTLYRNISDIDGMIIQNDGNDLNIYIGSKDIAKADIIFETPNSAPQTVLSSKSEQKFVWSIVSVLLLLLISYKTKLAVKKELKPDINEVIKEREKKLYRKFQHDIAALPSMNYKLKSYSKHVLKGETLRSYNSRTSVKIMNNAMG